MRSSAFLDFLRPVLMEIAKEWRTVCKQVLKAYEISREQSDQSDNLSSYTLRHTD